MIKKGFSYSLILSLSLILTGLSGRLTAKEVYSNVPVLVFVSSENQPDTMGFNLAAQLPELIYSLILQEKITLWDSPKKNIKISADALQSIERNTQTEFMKSKNIFLNELWTSSRKKFSFAILGFSFMNEGVKGKVSYGYVDAEEAAPHLFREQVKANANGSAFVSFMAALYSRRYTFTLVQFGNENFEKDILLEEKIRYQATYSLKKQESQINLQPVKVISYSINKKASDKENAGTLLFDGFEKLLYDNLEVFFELGADRYFDFKTYRSEFAITRIEIEEVWEKVGDAIIMSPHTVTLYVNNKKLNPLSIQELRTLKFNLGLKSIEDILLEKQFDFQLVKINRSFINQEESDLYLRALKEFSWTQLSRFVKYTKSN